MIPSKKKITRTSGKVMDACMNLYTCYCLPKKNAPIAADELLFGDQVNISERGNYLSTQEYIDFCD